MDFTYRNLTSLRFYYQVFQNKIPEINRGAGIYIYGLRSSLLNEDKKEGLYKVEHNQRSDSWDPIEKDDAIIDSKDFMIGAMKHNGSYSLETTVKGINKTRPENDKMPFNLYYAPGYLVDHGLEWSPPFQRISKTAGADEIAGILINSENQWTSGSLNAYNTHVFSESSKIVEQALKIAKRKGVKLTKHNFIFHSPLTSFQKLKQITTDCGAKFDDKSYSLGLKSKVHLLSQKNKSVANKDISIPNLDKSKQQDLTKKLAKLPARTQHTTFFEYLELIK